MKDKKRAFLFTFMMVLFFGNQTSIFGINLEGVKAKINDLDRRVNKFLKQKPDPVGKKLNNALDIQSKLKSLKIRVEDLNENDNDQIKQIDIQIGELNRQFIDPNYKQERSQEQSNEVSKTVESLPTNTSQTNSGLNDLIPRVEKIESRLESDLPKPFSWLEWGGIGLAGLLILGGVITVLFLLRSSIAVERDAATKRFDDLSRKHVDLSRKFSDLSEVTKNLSQQFSQSKAEIGALKLANVSSASYSAAQSTPPAENLYQAPREDPAFPVAVDDFLAKSKSGAIPVKYDYKERLLVEDDAREGGLFVVRNDSDRQLYLVPGFGFFQTKSDYTNYFERYYDCARPAGGSVWIRQPATVRQVSGGWELASQGELEVR